MSQAGSNSHNSGHLASTELSSHRRYSYHALPTQDSIRIIKLEPLKLNEPNEPLQCTLFTVKLSQVGEYLALSYTWGPREPVRQLRIDDSILGITPNLHAALLQLRSFWACPSYLWVDAVCVDQENLKERAQQVLLMRSIYQSARNTFSWIGEADTQGEQFISLIQTIHNKVCPADCTHGGTPRMGDVAFGDAEAMARHELPPPDHPSWLTLATLAGKTYFSRIWIIQETVCGSDNSWLFCGQLKLSWHDLDVATRYIGAQNWPLQIAAREGPPGNDSQLNQLRYGWPLLKAHIDVRLLVSYEKTGIECLLHQTRRFEATDPRDKIIGVLGLAHDVGPEKRFKIVPNYTKPVAEFYRDVTAEMLRSSLDILSEMEDPLFRQVPNLPSWVPDYSVTEYRPAARHNTIHKNTFHASGDSYVSVRWPEGSNRVYIGGHEIDRVIFSDRCVSRDTPVLP